MKIPSSNKLMTPAGRKKVCAQLFRDLLKGDVDPKTANSANRLLRELREQESMEKIKALNDEYKTLLTEFLSEAKGISTDEVSIELDAIEEKVEEEFKDE